MGLGLWRCQDNLRRDLGVVMIGEEMVVQILGWRVVIVGIAMRGGGRTAWWGGKYFLLVVEGG
jgi:hypothetical protein